MNFLILVLRRMAIGSLVLVGMMLIAALFIGGVAGIGFLGGYAFGYPLGPVISVGMLIFGVLAWLAGEE